MRQIDFCGRKVSRLIVGGNPFSGFSHQNEYLSRDMEDYFSAQNIKKTLYDCLNTGINTALMRGDKHIIRLLREFRLEGGDINWIGQTTPESASFEGCVSTIKNNGAFCMYHHGTSTDKLFRSGEYDELRRRLEVIRGSGLPVGLGSHMPEVIEYAQEQGWNVDFYVTCVYNIDKNPGVETFDEEDPPKMYKVIQSVDKPCIVFKILAAGRKCATPEAVENAFAGALKNIKPTDVLAVGMFPKYFDQVRQNARIMEKLD